ncbi:hypothetical protein L198_04450 [Cryptococcus wingfieldii CBS 7118]|uniref:Uncharacterized protein n=1 Tax=Cryptococcus wingfieldii CBS 7118 TaxID=1295528 RepID=A0A1E3J4Q8_9TREE|nr:hypothetical protein L198_04450 [Cryptococcus wingfieldii CBS 7118]ODN95832.1 hypothetical protein L198_04450 [Cryptococcus wingfieldii CBS 7118]
MPSGYNSGPKALVSPTNSLHPSPASQYSSLQYAKAGSSKSAPRPRLKSSHQRTFMSDSDSDLTPASSDEDEEDDRYESLVTPRKGAHKGRPSTAGGGSGSVQKSATKKAAPKKGKNPQAKKKSHSSKDINTKTTTGPSGRDKKKAIKLEDSEIRRARDAKFDVDQDFGDGVTPTQSASQHRSIHEDDASSYGDDESDHGITDEEHTIAGIPEAFIGQEIEDLAYGAGDLDAEMAFWGGAEDGSDDEDEEMYIDQLSGSEADRQSQSSVSIRDSDSSTDDETDDEVLDEFGFPVASAPHLPLELAENGAEDPGLILMENWDGQFVLVQPRVERSRSRHRGDRGSRTGASTNGSVMSGTELHNLTIDADAADREFESDTSSWSGLSDEDDGGDTTDSMAEEDMPMLDSPALNEMMEHQMADAVLNMTVDGGDISGMVLPEAVASVPGPAITFTEAVGEITPALSTTSSSAPFESNTLPTTPSSAEPTPSEMPAPSNVPQMGTFHPPTGDPAQHAVIDGSGLTTKSPFTHRRRSRRNRDAASLASSREDKERKRKSQSDIFSPSAMSPSTPKPTASTKSKKLRYSSIPGHPRYVAARRAAEALMPEEDRNTTTDDEEDGFNLEDMLEEGVLVDGAGEGLEGEPVAAEHLRHMLRFDRVGVSTYLRRNFGTPNAAAAVEPRASFSLGVASAYPSPGNARLDDTLVGAMGGRMLMSPVLGPVEEGRGRSGRKKEKKKRKQSASVMPELAI